MAVSYTHLIDIIVVFRLRHENEIIVEGVFHGLLEDNDDIYAYERIPVSYTHLHS